VSDRDCKHGHLARSCEICDLESQLATLQAQYDTRVKLGDSLRAQLDAARGAWEPVQEYLHTMRILDDSFVVHWGDTTLTIGKLRAVASALSQPEPCAHCNGTKRVGTELGIIWCPTCREPETEGTK